MGVAERPSTALPFRVPSFLLIFGRAFHAVTHLSWRRFTGCLATFIHLRGHVTRSYLSAPGVRPG